MTGNEAVSLRRSLVVCRHELRVFARDPSGLVVVVLMPLLAAVVLRPAFRLILVSEGYPGATGAEHAVPGMAVIFAFVLVSFVAGFFYREHGWGTWDRLRVTPVHTSELVVGKAIPVLLLQGVQLIVLFGSGHLLLGMRLRGSFGALALVGLAQGLALVAMGMAVTAFSHSIQQTNAFGNLAAIVLPSIGGALVPLSVLPDWVQTVAPASPAYWAMRGLRAVVLEGGGFSAVVVPVLVLLGFAAVWTIMAVTRFRTDERKLSWV